MRFEKPKKSGRPDFAAGRIAELERQLATETNETRKSELRSEINEWQRSRPQPTRRDERSRSQDHHREGQSPSPVQATMRSL